MLEIVMWGAIGMLVYIYLGYPALTLILARLFQRPVARAEFEPPVTFIISAYNEEKHIGAKISNTLALDYPADKLEVIVVSDASTDATDGIVQAWSAAGVRLLRIEGRLGKTACQNAAAAAASGEVLVFADATTVVDGGALRAITRNFNDPEVGCVAARLVYTARSTDSTGHGGSSYWKYESLLRSAESSLGSLIGVSGALSAVRASAYRPIPTELISDFMIALDVRDQGLRTVLEPEAICFEETLDRPRQELSMRNRVTLRSLLVLARNRHLLNPFRYGVFAWQLVSHKLLRYLSPVFWAVALGANLALAMQDRYVWLLGLQVAGILVGSLGFLPLPRLGAFKLLAQPYYFLLTNLSSAISLVRFIRGRKVVVWTPLR
ncbi:glycosyltransferase family 2 protein [Luteimonas sp. A478]